MGQNLPQNERSTVNSSTRMRGNTSRPHEGSLNPTNLPKAMIKPNVNPTGHTRQNTGNPNIAALPNAPQSMI